MNPEDYLLTEYNRRKDLAKKELQELKKQQNKITNAEEKKLLKDLKRANQEKQDLIKMIEEFDLGKSKEKFIEEDLIPQRQRLEALRGDSKVLDEQIDELQHTIQRQQHTLKTLTEQVNKNSTLLRDFKERYPKLLEKIEENSQSEIFYDNKNKLIYRRE